MTLQPQYSLLVREIEWEIVPAAMDAGLGLLPWSPLGGGYLSGQVHPRTSGRPAAPGSATTRPRHGGLERRGTERTWAVIDAVQQIAEARGVSMAEVALAWVTDRPGVTATILGARTTEQLRTNLGAADLHLPRPRPPPWTPPATRTRRLPVRGARGGPAGPPPRRRR